MNKKERILCAMNGQPTDRVPVTFVKHFPDLTDDTVDQTVQWVKNTGMDLVDVAADGYYALMSETPLNTIDSWLAFRPYDRKHPYIANQVARAARVVEQLKDDAAVFVGAFTPMSYFKHTLGSVTGENQQTLIMEHWHEHRDKVLQVLDVLEETNFILLEELSKTGVDGVGLSMQHGEKWRFSKEDYIRYMAPYDLRILDYVKSIYPNHYVHICSWGTADTNECVNLDLYQDYDMNAVNWGVHQRESMGMKEGRAFFRGSKAVMGGFDRSSTGVLYSGDEQAVKTFTKALIEETGDVGFILAADCSVCTDIPDEHIRWVVEAAEEYAAAK